MHTHTVNLIFDESKIAFCFSVHIDMFISFCFVLFSSHTLTASLSAVSGSLIVVFVLSSIACFGIVFFGWFSYILPYLHSVSRVSPPTMFMQENVCMPVCMHIGISLYMFQSGIIVFFATGLRYFR